MEKFLHICHEKKFEITPHVEKFHISSHLSCIKSEIFPHDNFFSTNMLVALETNIRYDDDDDDDDDDDAENYPGGLLITQLTKEGNTVSKRATGTLLIKISRS